MHKIAAAQQLQISRVTYLNLEGLGVVRVSQSSPADEGAKVLVWHLVVLHRHIEVQIVVLFPDLQLHAAEHNTGAGHNRKIIFSGDTGRIIQITFR